jgi:hypothetical protein
MSIIGSFCHQISSKLTIDARVIRHVVISIMRRRLAAKGRASLASLTLRRTGSAPGAGADAKHNEKKPRVSGAKSWEDEIGLAGPNEKAGTANPLLNRARPESFRQVSSCRSMASALSRRSAAWAFKARAAS